MTLSGCSRFAPSATGPAHPGTLLAGLLCWLDARSRGDRVVLRIEDLDPQRCSADKVRALIEHLQWFGLDDWDLVEIQSQHQDRHTAALQTLIHTGQLYACSCSRRAVREHGIAAADGGWVYPGTCRHRHLSSLDQALDQAAVVRIHLDGVQVLRDEGGADLSQDLPADMGDPVLRRRDGALSYHLASVVDDIAVGVTRIVRGRDLAPSSAIQARLRLLLGSAPPIYRHHLLLLEAQGGKMAKFHQAVGVPELSQHYTPAQLCGILACMSGLRADCTPCHPQDLLKDFTWQRVGEQDRVLQWNGSQLLLPEQP